MSTDSADSTLRLGEGMLAAALYPNPEPDALKGYAQGMIERGVPEEQVRQLYERLRQAFRVADRAPSWEELMSPGEA